MQPLGQICGGLALAMALCAPLPTWAEGSDFTFKRVTVGQPSTGARRITVQIDPVEQAKLLAANPAVPPLPEGRPVAASPVSAPASGEVSGKAPSSTYAWYWDLQSPDLSQRSSGRLDAAITALNNGPGGAVVRAPRLSTLQSIADTHGPAILAATIGTNVSPALALAVIGVESGGRPAAISSAGATGLMQLMPATAERFGVTDRTDPAQNIRGGVAYLHWLLGHFGHDPILALAGYNAGEGSVQDHRGVPPYAETRDYVPKVLAAWAVAKGLCVTQPQLISDGCVFRRSTAGQAGKPAVTSKPANG